MNGAAGGGAVRALRVGGLRVYRWISQRLGLRGRLGLMISGLLILAALAGAFVIVRQARKDIRDEVRSTMALTGHFLDAELDSLRNRRGLLYDPGATLFHLNRLRRVRHLEIRYYDEKGRLMEVSATAPIRSDAPDWFAWLVRASAPPMPDERRKVDLNGLTLGTLVIHPDPAFEINRMWQLSSGLFAVLGVFFLLINLLVWWAVSRALRPVRQVVVALGSVGEGRLAARLPAFDLPEMSLIGEGFNRMAGLLERSADHNRRLTRRLIDLQEQERRHLARELHDEIGQCITAIHADAAAIRARTRESDAVQDSAVAIVAASGQIKSLLRGLLQRLRPATLDRLGLEPALREVLAGFRKRQSSTRCKLEIRAPVQGLPDEIAITLFRVAQEALTNVERHARATRVSIVLSAASPDTDGAAWLVLIVEDDGCGFDADVESPGFGLTGMRERVTVLGGHFDIRSRPGFGTRIEVAVPAELKGAA